MINLIQKEIYYKHQDKFSTYLAQIKDSFVTFQDFRGENIIFYKVYLATQKKFIQICNFLTRQYVWCWLCPWKNNSKQIRHTFSFVPISYGNCLWKVINNLQKKISMWVWVKIFGEFDQCVESWSLLIAANFTGVML